MDTGLDNTKKLFSDLRAFTFWDRLFHWNKIRSLLIDASADLQKLIMGFDSLSKVNHELDIEKNKNKSLEASLDDLKILRSEKESLVKEKTSLESKNENYLKRGTELSNELSAAKQKIESLDSEIQKLREENTQYKTTEAQKRYDHDKAISNLTSLREQMVSEKNEETNRKHHLELEKLNKQKETWSNHEENVKNRIKAICNRHGVDYMVNVPFKGKPDNTLKIKDEYIVFDAKSPANDNLSNFPSYLKNQVESAIKYVKEEDVKKEVFLVVPTNTLDVVEQFEYKLSEYTVYIISIDALEPIILALKKIENYEFAEQLSPEERENICRIIGKFVHLSKRRIQIDGFFARQFFELVYRSEADLPSDFLEKVSEFEKSEKLNPPIEKRARQISTKELENDTAKLNLEANSKGILTEESFLYKELNKLPLYSTEEGVTKNEEQGNLF